MSTGTMPKSPLDGLVRCGRCGVQMDFVPATRGQEAQYGCNQDHGGQLDTRQPFHIPAHIADNLVLGEVLAAVLTDRAISDIHSVFVETDPRQDSGHTVLEEDITLLREDPQFFLRAVKTNENARNFLANFITQINLYPGRAVVHYAMPLPSDSHLAGATEQEVPLSTNLAS